MKNKLLNSIKNKMLQKLIVMSMLCIAYTLPSMSQSILEDTIWYKRMPTDYYIKDVKFVKNDQLIVVNGSIFYNTNDGTINKTIENADNKKFVWFETDKSFIIHNNNKKIDYIYNIDNFEIIDSIVGINCLPFTAPHKRIFADTIDNRLRFWDYESKKIIKSIQFETIPNISRYEIIPTFSHCDYNNFFVKFLYFINPTPDKPNGEFGSNDFKIDYEKMIIQDTVGDTNPLPYKEFQDQFRASNDCGIYLANYGYLEVHDYQSSELLKKIDMKGNSISKFCISDDNNYLIGVGTGSTTIINLLKGEFLYRYEGGNLSVDIAKDNSKFVTASNIRFVLVKTKFKETSIETSNQTPNVIYPNPTSNKIAINFNSTIANVQFTIVKQNGEILKNAFTKADISQMNNLEIDFSLYPSGVYFVNLKVGNGNILNFKVVKV